MKTASQLKCAGQQQCLFNEREDWLNDFLTFAHRYSDQHAMFKMEDIRTAWLDAGNPEPHHFNVWGSIPLEKSGVAKFHGYVKSTRPCSHARVVKQYRSLASWER